jgi:phenylalanyl-tRNA synthetase alpha chain
LSRTFTTIPGNLSLSIEGGSDIIWGMSLLQDLQEIDDDLCKIIAKISTADEINQLKDSFFGKKGRLSCVMQQIRSATPEEKPLIGQKVNEIKSKYLGIFDDTLARLQSNEIDRQLSREAIDITLPGHRWDIGQTHPIREAENELIRICESMGFSVATGPIVEDMFHNFQALNIPETHPSRDMHDTFYLGQNMVLRTHTSSVQIRYMTRTQPPFKIVSPGPVFRCDSDRTHSPMFHQLEGLYVNHQVSLPELKYTLEQLLTAFFNEKFPIRYRSSYFPFTEPSFEVDVKFKKTGEWMEVLGAGMVHRNVFRSVNYNPDQVTGFAFGLGVDRLAMLKYGVEDIRSFYENDIRFIRKGQV